MTTMQKDNQQNMTNKKKITTTFLNELDLPDVIKEEIERKLDMLEFDSINDLHMIKLSISSVPNEKGEYVTFLDVPQNTKKEKKETSE